METSILRTLATLSLSAVLGPISLWAQGPIHVTVPFDFTVGAKSLAAGEYRVNQQAPMSSRSRASTDKRRPQQRSRLHEHGRSRH
jgi:hypothetical protein